MAGQEATMAATKDTQAIRVNLVTELLHSHLGKVSTILSVIHTDIPQQRIQGILAVAYGAAKVYDQEAKTLEEEHLSTCQKHMIR